KDFLINKSVFNNVPSKSKITAKSFFIVTPLYVLYHEYHKAYMIMLLKYFRFHEPIFSFVPLCLLLFLNIAQFLVDENNEPVYLFLLIVKITSEHHTEDVSQR